MKGDGTKKFALDASVTLAWCFPDESTPDTEAILNSFHDGAEAVAPAIWPFEVANALLAGEKRKRLTIAQISSVLQRIAALPIKVEPITIDRAFGQIILLARQYHLTEYDAAYLEVALRETLPLATLDERLKAAAGEIGVRLIAS